MRRLSVLSASLWIALSSSATGALAEKPPTVPAFGLQSEYVQNSPNPAAPTWCLNEDDFHQRTWSGYLSGTFATTEQLCDASVDYSGGMYWDAGGIGLQADLYVVGTLTRLTITSPQGAVQSGVLVGSQDLTANQKVVQNHYQVCAVPPYSRATDTGGKPLPGGTWTLSLAGDFSQAKYTVTAVMANVSFQQQHCPVSEQNLTT
jgi:hypothetical protein